MEQLELPLENIPCNHEWEAKCEEDTDGPFFIFNHYMKCRKCGEEDWSGVPFSYLDKSNK